MRLATLCEINITEFWEITPFELNIVAESYAERTNARQKESIHQAYLISRWVWAKKLDIDKILGQKKEKKIMSDNEMLEQVKILNAIFGGNVVEK